MAIPVPVVVNVFCLVVGYILAVLIGQNLPLLQQASAATVLLTLPVIGIAFIAQKLSLIHI